MSSPVKQMTSFYLKMLNHRRNNGKIWYFSYNNSSVIAPILIVVFYKVLAALLALLRTLGTLSRVIDVLWVRTFVFPPSLWIIQASRRAGSWILVNRRLVGIVFGASWVFVVISSSSWALVQLIIEVSFICKFAYIALRIALFIFGRSSVVVSMYWAGFKSSSKSVVVIRLIILNSIESFPLFS